MNYYQINTGQSQRNPHRFEPTQETQHSTGTTVVLPLLAGSSSGPSGGTGTGTSTLVLVLLVLVLAITSTSTGLRLAVGPAIISFAATGTSTLVPVLRATAVIVKTVQ